MRASQIVDEIIATMRPEFFRALEGRGSDSGRPIFIVGMPRSGTTLTEQILASHPRVFGAGELEDLPELVRELAGEPGMPVNLVKTMLEMTPDSVRTLAQRYVARLVELGGATERVVDKLPLNYLHLGVDRGLVAAVADSILCRRDPQAVHCISCWATYFGGIRWANDLRVVAKQIIDHDRLIAHWKSVLPIPIIEVVYEELVADFESQARRLVEAVGLPWDSACLEYHSLKRTILTASLAQGPGSPSTLIRSVDGRITRPPCTPLLETFTAHCNHPISGRTSQAEDDPPTQ